ncbi:hypothetical protein GDO78_013695 [Eleutherodactylus coqui]|uniref:Uncharacterized protein n=1 Tax=Eleutherodactylus coqui TaxID=57060 RepID=A0A8J6JLR5_ELECQ|nr:hypothetical protein GDO78_013695 [Eleutherodactylus coqui]
MNRTACGGRGKLHLSLSRAIRAHRKLQAASFWGYCACATVHWYQHSSSKYKDSPSLLTWLLIPYPYLSHTGSWICNGFDSKGT